jgi:glutamine synthetase
LLYNVGTNLKYVQYILILLYICSAGTIVEFAKLQEIQNLETCLKLTKNADFVLLHFTDVLGYLKGRTIPAEETRNALTKGVTFDGSSMLGGVGIEDSDMIMKPDMPTFTAVPYYFYDKSVASFICDIKRSNEQQFEGDPRDILRREIDNIRKEGYSTTAAAELEFYLVQKNEKGEIIPVENHLIDKQRYFDIAPGRDLTESYRMDLTEALSTLGIVVERQHHEVGSAQNEITFKYSDPAATADSIMRYKFAAKAVAEKKYGWTATFMPKPWEGKAGSGMHVHLGLFDARKGENPFFDPNSYGYISQECRYFIGGILEHARALCAVVAPAVNSYKRLVPGYEAPVYIAWSKKNRSALVRIPAFSADNPEEARIEFRCPDPLCNPYLTYAVVFEAGLEGIKNKIDPGDPVDANIYHISEADRNNLGIKTLPASLEKALEEWSTDDLCTRTLGKDTADKYTQLKNQEWQEYQTQVPKDANSVTAWEVQKYLFA